MASLMKREWTTKSGERKVAWQVQYLVNGKKKRRQFPTERKARRFVETVAVVRTGDIERDAKASTPLFSDVAASWLETRACGADGKPPLDPETVVWYRGIISNHILPALGQLRVGEIGRQDVRAFREALLKRGKLSRRTVRKVLVAVGTILRASVESDMISSNPAEGVSIAFSTRTGKEIAIHTVSEMKTILRTAESLCLSKGRRGLLWSSRYYPMLLILVYGGLRISEVRGLNHKDIDFDPIVVRVRQRADRRGRIGAPKSAKGFRQVHLPDYVEPFLRRVVEPNQDGLLFQSSTGRAVDCANFRKRAWEHVQKAAKVRVLTLHSCRHFFASRQISDGINPKELADIIGHADEAFTLKTYGHLFRDNETETRRRNRANALVLSD